MLVEGADQIEEVTIVDRGGYLGQFPVDLLDLMDLLQPDLEANAALRETLRAEALPSE